VSENGNNVSRAELQAHLDPIRATLWEVKADVKTLLLRQAASQGAVKEKRVLSDRRLAWGAIVLAPTVTALLHFFP
jgi:hypothetical protein